MQKIENSNLENATCGWSGCSGEGKFPAPKSPENRDDRYYFCLEHIREYNKSWDFFRKMNMDSKQIDSFQNDLTGHRPTWKFGVNNINFSTMEEIRNQVFGKFRGTPGQHYKNRADSDLPRPVRDALKTLGLQYPITLQEIKKRYKKLAKEYHPDLNDHKNDDKIKSINQAYSYLKGLEVFKR